MQIALESLTKRFGSLRALENISLTIQPGQIVGILGPNGRVRRRCFDVFPPSQRPTVDAFSMMANNSTAVASTCASGLDFCLNSVIFPQLTVARHIAMVLGLYGKDGESTASIVTQHLHELDLLPAIDTPIGQLSRGQIYKAALATLLSADPELWLLDEPFASGMDPIGIAYFKRQARLAVERGRTILYSTQILDVAEKFSDRVCLIHRGKLRVFDAVANLHVRPRGEDCVLEDVFRQLREEEQ